MVCEHLPLTQDFCANVKTGALGPARLRSQYSPKESRRDAEQPHFLRALLSRADDPAIMVVDGRIG